MASDAFLEKSDVFTSGTDGYAVYRIPGIVVTKRGTVLAYCEARKNGSGDWTAIDILLRRSTDGGKTWEAPRKAAHLAPPVPRHPLVLERSQGRPDEQTVNNAVAITDAKKGTVHILYCVEYSHCFVMRSDDDGITFTKPVEITATFEAFRHQYDWKVLATGPGHGIQLRNGRLVVPVWLSTSTHGLHHPSVTATIYSDDQGRTWKAGDIAVPNTEAWVDPNETAIAQLADGRVMLNVRNESQAGRRIVVTSLDGATGWSTPKFDDHLWEPVCYAALVRYSTASSRDQNHLLFSNPNNLTHSNPKGSPDRKNLTVKLSTDEGSTWPTSRVLDPGMSGYSDLAVLPDKTILCLYERGEVDARGRAKIGALTIARFNLEWLTNGESRGERRESRETATALSEPGLK